MATAPEKGHVFVSIDEAVHTKRADYDVSSFHYLGTRGDMSPGPKAFLVEPAPGIEIDSHFHPIDQYQVMFGSPDCYYQRHLLTRPLLHYTDAYSVYGPFGSGPEHSMRFFTLRGEPTDLHGSMPESRDKLLYHGKRHFQIELGPFLDKGIPKANSAEVDVLIEPDHDGLAAYMVRIGPEGEFTPPEGSLETGRYTCVIEGALKRDGRAYGPYSLGWSAKVDSDLTLRAGPDGCALLLLHFPAPSTPTAQLASAGAKASA